MARTSEVLLHVLRTFALVAVAAAAILLTVWLIFLLAPRKAIPYLLVGLVPALIVFIVFASRWAPFSSPYFDSVDRVRWTDETGQVFDSVVERARVDAPILAGLSVVRLRVLRISVYASGNGRRRRRKRVLVGDEADYLGRHGGRFWFLIHNRFYAKRRGLVGHDEERLDVSFHLPGGWTNRGGKGRRDPVIHLEGPEGTVRIDLRDPGPPPA